MKPTPTKKRPHRRHGEPMEGPNATNWKGGRSKGFMRKFLPQRLIARFDEIVNDPELTSVRTLMAVTSVRLTELMEKISTRESRVAWDAIGQIAAQLVNLTDSVTPKQRGAFSALIEALQANYKTAHHEHVVWDEIHRLIERARRLAQTEQEREKTLQANLTAAQAIALMNRIFQLHAELITDAHLRYKLGMGLIQLLKHESPEAAGRLLPAGDSHESPST